jgi:catechol 2,3-dioxygenase-like lactoylglutathione lyase family enzyme
MLLYTNVGAHDLQAAYKFYDAVLKPLGYVRLKEFATEVGYGPQGDQPRLWVLKPINGLPATFGNGSMICFAAPSRKAVDVFHAAALANGGYDEGKPGIRSVEDGFFPNYYAAFVRDPTGNKLSAGCDKPE